MPKQQNDTAARPLWNRLWRQRPTPRGSISPNKMNRAAPYLFLAPSLAGLCVFVLVPFADAVRRSFTDAMGSRFVGFANYASVLGNSAFRLAAGNTARFIGVCAPAAVRQPAAGRGRARRKATAAVFLKQPI